MSLIHSNTFKNGYTCFAVRYRGGRITKWRGVVASVAASMPQIIAFATAFAIAPSMFPVDFLVGQAYAACGYQGPVGGYYVANGGSACQIDDANYVFASNAAQSAVLQVYGNATMTFTGDTVEINNLGGTRHSISVGYPVATAGTLIVNGDLLTTSVNGQNQRALLVQAGSKAIIDGNLTAIRNGNSGGAAVEVSGNSSILEVGGNSFLSSNVTNALRAGGIQIFHGDLKAETSANTSSVLVGAGSLTTIDGSFTVNSSHTNGIGMQVNGGHFVSSNTSSVTAGGNAIYAVAGTVSLGGIEQPFVDGVTTLAIGDKAVIKSENAYGAVVAGTQAQNIIIDGEVSGNIAAIQTVSNSGQSVTVEFRSQADVRSIAGVAYSDLDGNSEVTILEGARLYGAISLGNGSDTLTFVNADISKITTMDGGDDLSAADSMIDEVIFRDGTYSVDGSSVINWEKVTVDNSILSFADSALVTGSDDSQGLSLVNGGKLLAGNTFALTGNMNVGPNSSLITAGGGSGLYKVSGNVSNAGTIALSEGKAGDVLMIDGNYSGDGGLLTFDTALNNDASITDMMIVGGDSSGASMIKVTNVNGVGAPTVEGIKIIDIVGISSGTFSLLGNYEFQGKQAVVGGAYAYQLYQGGVSTPDDGNWYLRSELKPVPPVDQTNPDDPTTPVKPSKPLYQAGVPIYEAYPQALLGLNGVPTLQQRVGNRFWAGNGNKVIAQGADPIGTPYAAPQEAGVAIDGNGVWGRIEGVHHSINPRFSTSSTDYDQNVFKLQAGIDGLLTETENGKLIGGITVHYAHGKTDVNSVYGDGEISTNGYGFGGTLTWYGENGFYLDGQGQVTWYKSDLDSLLANANLTDGNKGFGYTLSLEGGKRIALDPAWSLTPQAQLVYSNVDFDDFTDPFGARVSLERGESLQGGLGLTLDHEDSWQNDNGTLNRTHVYGIANLYYEFLEGTRVDVAGTGIASEKDRLWGGLGVGGSYNWNDDKYSIYGEGLVNTSLNNFGDSYSLKGTVGFRMKW